MTKTVKESGLVREEVGGQVYEYYPLGKHIVSAPGICGGRPTFKYTRIEVEVFLDLLAAGHSVDELVENYQGRVPREAVQEALHLAASLLKQKAEAVVTAYAAGATGAHTAR